MEKLKVLFICRDNSVRSQMAAAMLNAYFGERYEACSAGVDPLKIDPRTVKVMQEIGIDLSSSCAKSIEEFRGKKFACVITLCDYAEGFLGRLPEHKKKLHKSFKDYCLPHLCQSAAECGMRSAADAKYRNTDEEKTLTAFRCLKEEIAEWVEKEVAF